MPAHLGTLRTGTSGIVVPGPKATFPAAYQATSRLTYYATLFNSVEINSTFYRIPLPKTFAAWAAETGPDFDFTIKLWRDITHAKALVEDLSGIARFLEAARELGPKRGCLLIQFPPSNTIRQLQAVNVVLAALAAADPAHEWRKAVEFRHPSWYADDAFDMLDHHGASLVLHDKGPARNAQLNEGAGFVYMRFHGPKGNYRESYERDFLHDTAEQIHDYLQEGKDVYAYFNNTMGAAFENAQDLYRLVAERA
ncbi:DUF72 domain-containing protein [Hymenobacter sp. 5317J-9]|uniref:DUF72 domain-containing protein n=1 Tax=Hymenobacter sp. 5317J-9 TaxID=2932250 RepID=UPI001FD69767|nr:DUF72 domain-containing protein [Hymenobacter sp. 5317J-9]UOQ97140.1 DUF72 domain-containing protein [Hymenobacter sp. 5317J-9]